MMPRTRIKSNSDQRWFGSAASKLGGDTVNMFKSVVLYFFVLIEYNNSILRCWFPSMLALPAQVVFSSQHMSLIIKGLQPNYP
jgi:hypothetical protein